MVQYNRTITQGLKPILISLSVATEGAFAPVIAFAVPDGVTGRPYYTDT